MPGDWGERRMTDTQTLIGTLLDETARRDAGQEE